MDNVLALETESSNREPMYAEPGLLDDGQIKELVGRTRRHRSDSRKSAQALRDRLLRSKHTDDIREYIRTLYVSKDLAKRVNNFVSRTANPFADIVRQVVQLYKSGAIRRIDGVSKEQQAAFDALVLESRIDVLAQGWAETGYGVGPQFVLPVVRRESLRLLAPPPQSSDIVLDALDPTSDPVALAYPSGARSVVVVDAEATRTFDLDANGGVDEDEDLRIEHQAKDMPAAALRFTPAREDSDWWDCDINGRLQDGALVVGHWAAKLGLVRKGQGGKLLGVTGPLGSLARGQTAGDPEGPILIPTDSTDDVDGAVPPKVETHDFDTDPANNLRHIRAITEWMAESTGVQVQVETNGADQWDYSWNYDALAELRTGLMFWAMLWERQLWTFAVAVAKAQKHPLASKLPSREQVEAGFFLDLPPLHRKFSDPLQEQKHWDWLISRGCASFLDVGRRFIGNRTDKALHAQITRNLEINGIYFDELTKRNNPADGDLGGKHQTIAQAQGAMGPAVRDGQAPKPGGDGEDTTNT